MLQTWCWGQHCYLTRRPHILPVHIPPIEIKFWDLFKPSLRSGFSSFIRTEWLYKIHLTYQITLRHFLWTHFFLMFPFDFPVNIRKPKFLWCFQGGQKRNLGREGLKSFQFYIQILNSPKEILPCNSQFLFHNLQCTLRQNS